MPRRYSSDAREQTTDSGVRCPALPTGFPAAPNFANHQLVDTPDSRSESPDSGFPPRYGNHLREIRFLQHGYGLRIAPSLPTLVCLGSIQAILGNTDGSKTPAADELVKMTARPPVCRRECCIWMMPPQNISRPAESRTQVSTELEHPCSLPSSQRTATNSVLVQCICRCAEPAFTSLRTRSLMLEIF